MGKYTLNKSIEARKLNARTGAPSSPHPATVPYGALIDKIVRDRDTVRFRYLVELYECPYDLLASALETEPVEETSPESVEEMQPEMPAGPPPPLVRWQQLGAQGGGPALTRAKVPGGWLISARGSGIGFYPDPDHRWDGASLED